LGAEVSAIRQFRDAARTVSFAALSVAFATSVARAEEACRFVTIGSAHRRAAEAGITLEDGRTLRLAGIEFANSTALPPGTALILKRLSAAPETDRYGRLSAHAFITEDGAEHWLQADLVSRGLARVSSRIGDPACARLLLAREQTARAEKVGLWGEPVYVMGKAEDPAEVLKQRGRFALVEGKVLSVRESGGIVYLNFGRRWIRDFAVTVLKRNERQFAAAGMELKKLEGRRVRIRGWVEERGGPRIEAQGPEQIEIAERN